MKRTIKKVIAPVLALLILVGAVAVSPVNATVVTSGDFQYEVLENGTAEITDYTGTETVLTIPSEIDGYSITSIGNGAFWGCTKLTSVTIADGITNIGNNAFYSCFSLTSISIPGSVISIGEYAFFYCSKLESLEIPDSVINIGELALACSHLENISVSENNSVYSSVDGVLFNKDLTKIITYPKNKAGINYDIPDSVVDIGNYAFSDSRLASITISNNVTSIGNDAFNYCRNLRNITIPESVASIGDFAFYYCDRLENATISKGVTSIGEYAFSSCKSLTNITIPNSVTNIGVGAFANCDSLKTVSIPDSITRIESYTFADCTGLDEVIIPRSVTRIESWAFEGTLSRKNIKIPETVTYIGAYAFGYLETEHGPYGLPYCSISGYAGTAAERYAKANDIEFIELFKYYGDADNDGTVTVKDATQIQMYLADFVNEFGIDLTVSDVNNDQDINISDATMIQMYLADFETNTDIGKVVESETEPQPTDPTAPSTQPETQPTTGEVILPEYSEPYTGW